MGEVMNSIAAEAVRLKNEGYKVTSAVDLAKDISYQDTIRMAVLSHNEELEIDYKNLKPYQWRCKLMEEISEVIHAKSEENELEELWDVGQLVAQRINMICKDDKLKLKDSNRKHLEKLTERGWVEEKSLEILIYKGV